MLCGDRLSTHLGPTDEYTIIEWSPSGKYVKLRSKSGVMWKDRDANCLNVLEVLSVNNGREYVLAGGRPKVVVFCGSSRFVEIMAIAMWICERDEMAIAMGLHLIPRWYSDDLPDSHLAEHEGVASDMDELHKRKIDLANEVYIVDFEGYVGRSTASEIDYASACGKKVRRLSDDSDPLSVAVMEVINAARERERKLIAEFDQLADPVDSNTGEGRR